MDFTITIILLVCLVPFVGKGFTINIGEINIGKNKNRNDKDD